MSFLKEFACDIFVSYSHIDNRTSDEQPGWVTHFCESLQERLDKLSGTTECITIWNDECMDLDMQFNDEIRERIDSTALFCAINSHSYINSSYCKQELGYFREKVKNESFGLYIENHCRIFNIQLYTISPNEWPDFGTTTGYPFHTAKKPHASGFPLKVTSNEYDERLWSLAEDILKILCTMSKATSDSKVSSCIKEQRMYDVYVATVSETQNTTRKKIINMLTSKGISVCGDIIPPPFPSNEHERKIREILERSRYSVHLFDNYCGERIQDQLKQNYPRRQAEIAFDHSAAQRVWVRPGMKGDDIYDDTHALFLQELSERKDNRERYRYFNCPFDELVNDLVSELTELQQPAATEGKRPRVCLDRQHKDDEYAFNVKQCLFSRNFDVDAWAEGESTTISHDLFKDFLYDASAFVIIYGMADEAWVQSRIDLVMHLSVNNRLPLKLLCVYLAPSGKNQRPITSPVPLFNIINIDNRNGFKEEAFLPVCAQLTAGRL